MKVGAVRIKVGDGPAERTRKFRQILTTKDGTLSASYGEGEAQVDLRLWLDANRPVICVEAQTAKPSTASAMLELWRNAATELAEKQVSDVHNAGSFLKRSWWNLTRFSAASRTASVGITAISNRSVPRCSQRCRAWMIFRVLTRCCTGPSAP